MKNLLILMILFACLVSWAQQPAQKPAPPPNPGEEYSGMYTFLKEGEFVQITVEEAGKVTGFVSRYGDLDSDRGMAFLDQFFKEGKLDGQKLSFTTETVHGEWFDFKGTVERGEGKNPGDEAYYVLKGTLLQYSQDPDKKVTSKTRDILFKLFPKDEKPASAKRQ